MPRRHVTAIAIGSAAALAWVAACSFPDVRFEPDGAEGGPDGNGNPVEDGGVLHDAVSEADFDDVVTRDDASQRVDEAGCGANPCDCDGDGNENASCAEAGTADCDDFDPLIFRGQTWVDVPWPVETTHTPNGDWNCDGNVERQYPVNLNCGALSSCSGEGFSGSPPCGASAPYYRCNGALVCARQEFDKPRTQGCR
jgi:hypothetical protein